MPKQQCPLCGKDAKFKQAPYGTENKCFSCTECLNFVVSPATENLLTNAPEDWKNALSMKSKDAPDDKVLLMFVEAKSDKKKIVSRYEKEAKWF